MARPRNLTPQVAVYLDPRGTGFYLGRWTDPATGKRVLRGTGKTTEDDARAEVPSILAKFYNPAPAEGWRARDLLDAYIAARTQEDCSPTFKHNFTHVRSYFGAFTADQLNDDAFKRYRRHRTSHTVANAGARASKAPAGAVSDSTAVRELNALAGAITWGRSNGYKGLDNVVVSRKGAPKNVRHRYLTRAEVERLLKACIEPHTALFVRLSLATGARMSAVLGLKWIEVTFPANIQGAGPGTYQDSFILPVFDDDDMPRGAVKLSGIITLDLGQGRGNKRRGTGVVSPSNWKLWNALVNAYNEQDTFIEDPTRTAPDGGKVYAKKTCDLVVNFRGRQLGKVDLTDAYRRAGITGATQHTLKHTTCSHLVQAGVSYERIGKLIGTSARIIESTYGHLSPEHLKTAGDVLSYA